MSRTSETRPETTLRCANPECGKTLAKDDSIKCRCGTVTPIPIHFYPGRAIGGGSLEQDWADHRAWARKHGCSTCGITPDQPEPAPTVPAGSHSLALRYKRVPASLDTVGTDYPLPEFGEADPHWLEGARVLVISADGPELPELDVPINYLRQRGAIVDLAGQDWIFQYRDPAGHIVIAEWLSDRICIQADLRLSDVKIEDYDALFVPGGAWNPDMLRTDATALSLVRRAGELGILVVSLCHGPQVIISAAFDAPDGETCFPSKGVEITGTGSIRRDLANAGFVVFHDRATVYDAAAGLLTARDPNDLGALCEEFGRLLKQRLSTR
ncbi:MAG: DJ-1/PfpI family protein [Candidatus Melainabacteria bacterium]|nr:DJ-1/PfpI family protein [Candidatus Melainabacteria bacterium]